MGVERRGQLQAERAGNLQRNLDMVPANVRGHPEDTWRDLMPEYMGRSWYGDEDGSGNNGSREETGTSLGLRAASQQ